MLGERFRRGKLQKARAGHWIAGQGPYGYRYVPNRDGVPGHLEVEEAEAEVVRMLYRWLIDERMTVRQILKRLAAGPWRPRNGKRLWSNSVVHRVLSDPLYAGTAYANRHVLVAPRRPRSTGPRAGLPTCRRLAARGVDPHPGAGHRRRDYLSRCERTIGPQLGPLLPQQHPQRVPAPLPAHLPDVRPGHVRRHDQRGRRAAPTPLLHVPRQGHPGPGPGDPCPQPRPRAEELDAAVWDHVKRLLDDPSTLAAQFEERARQADALDADARAAGQKWEAQLRRLDREEQRLLDAYQAEAIELDELKQRREQIGSRKHTLSMHATRSSDCAPNARRRRRPGST